MNSALPHEIIDEIIDQVGPPVLIGFNDDERRSNLRACSLVCQSWVHRSRKNMFHYIRLYSVETWNKIKETLNWLPHHAKDVKILCIVSDSLLETFQPNEFLVELASVLPFIKNLTFSNVKIKLFTDNSTHLPFRFDTIEELSFDDVKLHTMTKFSSLIEAFPSLTHLTLDSIYLSRKIENSALPNFESLSYRTPVNLHRISVYHDRFWSPPTPVHEWIACSPMTAFVTHFTQYGPPFQYISGEEQRISLSKCLQSRAHSLVCLRLPAYIFRTKSNLHSSLQLCTSLQEFGVSGVDGYHIAGVVEALQHLRYENIKKLLFGLLWRRGIEEGREGEWNTLDDILCKDTLNLLKLVWIGFENYLEHAVDMGKYLPRALEKGILKVQGSDDIIEGIV